MGEQLPRGETTLRRSGSLKKRLRFTAVGLLLAAVGPIVMTTSASASGGGDGCNPGRSDDYLTYHYAGEWEGSISEVGALKAEILNYSPYVYGPNSDYSTTEWVMLADNYYNYVQVGWDEAPSGSRATFTSGAYGDGSSWWFNGYPADPINSVTNYQIYFNGGSGTFNFYDNDTEVEEHYLGGWDPTTAEIETETHTQASQTPGGYDNPNYMYNASYYVPSPGDWYPLYGNASQSDAYSAVQIGSDGSYDTWDWACAY